MNDFPENPEDITDENLAEFRELLHRVDPDDIVKYYDKEGTQISLFQYAEYHQDDSYWQIAHDKVGDHFISTVWMGINTDLSWFTREEAAERPLIFETMVFRGQPGHDDHSESLEAHRYRTEQEAIAGHAELVLLISATTPDPTPKRGIWERFKNWRNRAT